MFTAAAWDARLEALVSVERGGAVEGVHRGVVVLADASGRVLGGVGDPGVPVLLRSAAKPFQALPLVSSGIADRLGITQEELAVACASHHGQPEHLRAVRSLLARAGVGEEALACGPEAPLDPTVRRDLERRGEAPGAIHHTCSGKHAGMLALARGLGVPTQGYADREHAVQQTILATLAGLLPGRTDETAFWDGTDGCGVPVFRVPAWEGAQLFALLAQAAEPGLARVRDAMLSHPTMVAGSRGLDTAIMAAVPGGVVAKGGAEGVQALAFPATSVRGPLGCLIKVGDGGHRGVRAMVSVLLQALGEDRAAADLLGEADGTIRNAAGTPVGRLRPLFGERDLVRAPLPPAPDGAVHPSGERSDAARVQLGDVRLSRGGGSERDVVRFLHDQWPSADEEILGRAYDWRSESFVLVARERREVVGVLRAHVVGGVATVEELLVHRARRGRGVGTRLLSFLEVEARSRRCHKASLRTPRGSRAEAFYRGRGYVREYVIPRHHFGFDYVSMSKGL